MGETQPYAGGHAAKRWTERTSWTPKSDWGSFRVEIEAANAVERAWNCSQKIDPHATDRDCDELRYHDDEEMLLLRKENCIVTTIAVDSMSDYEQMKISRKTNYNND